MNDLSGQFNSSDQGDPMVGRILDAAERCIERFGIRRTSMGEVARVGKLSRGSIYHHFGDKGTLVQAVLHRRQQIFLNETEAELEQQQTLVDKLMLSVTRGRAAAAEGLIASLAETEPETVAMMYLSPGFYTRSVSFWPPHVELARQQGEISSSVSAETATDFLMRLAVSLVMFPEMGVKLDTPARLRAYIEQAIHRGLS